MIRAATLGLLVLASCGQVPGPDQPSPAGVLVFGASAGDPREAADTFAREDLDFAVHLGGVADRSWEGWRALGQPLPGIPERGSAFSQNGWRVILLDGHDISPQARPAGGGVGIVQLLWLDAQLAEADAAGETAVVLCRFPALPAGERALENADEVLAVLRAHPCSRLYLAGGDGGHLEQWGIHFLTLRAMHDGGPAACALIRLTPREILVDGAGREPDRVLAIR